MVFLKDIEGTTTVLDIEPIATVDELRAQIAEENDFDAEELRILFAGMHFAELLLTPESGPPRKWTDHLRTDPAFLEFNLRNCRSPARGRRDARGVRRR